MKILIIGADGQLGSDVAGLMSHHQVLRPSHRELDISDKEATIAYALRYCPDMVFNFSAFHVVEQCETDPLQAYRTNTVGTENLARICRDGDIPFYTVSTDYVFDGTKGTPYLETDPPRPLMTYGVSKLAGELRALTIYPNSHIIRTASLYGMHPCRAKPGGSNFVTTMLTLAQRQKEIKAVADIQSCPTYTAHLAAQIKHLAANAAPGGIYHVVNNGGISWYAFAKHIFDKTGQHVTVTPVPDSFFPTSFVRPKNTALKNDALNKLGLNIMPPWDDALEDYLSRQTSLIG